MSRNKSAKDIAFDKERLKLRRRIYELEESARYWKLECEKETNIHEYNEKIIAELESQIAALSEQIGVPKDELLADIERRKKFEQSMNAIAGLSKHLNRMYWKEAHNEAI
ncbi:MAG: hypothetical protein AB7D36_09085 [Oscillospiraceae bacterium]